jgi:hypothetical protein
MNFVSKCATGSSSPPEFLEKHEVAKFLIFKLDLQACYENSWQSMVSHLLCHSLVDDFVDICVSYLNSL